MKKLLSILALVFVLPTAVSAHSWGTIYNYSTPANEPCYSVYDWRCTQGSGYTRDRVWEPEVRWECDGSDCYYITDYRSDDVYHRYDRTDYEPYDPDFDPYVDRDCHRYGNCQLDRWNIWDSRWNATWANYFNRSTYDRYWDVYWDWYQDTYGDGIGVNYSYYCESYGMFCDYDLPRMNDNWSTNWSDHYSDGYDNYYIDYYNNFYSNYYN